MRTLIALLAALALVAAPVAIAAAGGKSAEHANEKAADGQLKSSEARANATQEDDDADANETKGKDENRTAPAGNAWGHWWKRLADDWKNMTKSGEKPWHADATAKSHANATHDADDGNATHEPKRNGWTKAMGHVPSKVRAFMDRVLSGIAPRDAHES